MQTIKIKKNNMEEVAKCSTGCDNFSLHHFLVTFKNIV